MANPLIKLEVMRRFRSQSAAWSIPLITFLPGVAVTLIYWTTTSNRQTFNQFGEVQQGGAFAVNEMRGIGVGMFVAVLVTLLVALAVTVPATVGGSIAGERHSQTLQPLQLTAVTPTQIVIGKLVASLGYLFVLILCVAPVIVIPFLLGGLTAAQVLGAYGVLVLITIEYAAISLAVSARMARPAPAIMVSLALCAFLTVAPWIVMGMGFVMASRGNPVFDAGESAIRYAASPSPISMGSWVPMGDEIDMVIRPGDRVLSAAWFAAVVVASLLYARAKVVAPVERDR